VSGCGTYTASGYCGAAFRPTDAIVALRAYLRHRETLVQSAGTHVQRMQKALIQMNLQLPLVVSDITGVTGLRILRDIVTGQRDPQVLAQHRNYRCHASVAEIVGALTSNYRPEHLFALQQNLELFDIYQQQIAACDAAIEAHLHALTAQAVVPTTPLPSPLRDRSRATMNRDLSCERRCTSSPVWTSRKSMRSVPIPRFAL
jgi:transposase